MASLDSGGGGGSDSDDATDTSTDDSSSTSTTSVDSGLTSGSGDTATSSPDRTSDDSTRTSTGGSRGITSGSGDTTTSAPSSDSSSGSDDTQDARDQLTDRDPGSDGSDDSADQDARDELTSRDPGSDTDETTRRDPTQPRQDAIDELTQRDQGGRQRDPRDDAIDELTSRDQASRQRDPRATQTRARQIADEQVDSTLQEGLEGVQGNPLQQQALALEQQAITAYAWADDPSDIAVVREGDDLVALPSRSARVDATAGQLVDQTQDRRQAGGVQTERERATQALEARLEAQSGVDLEPGEDFVVEQTGDGRWQARLLPGFGSEEERIQQARQEDDIFSGAVARFEDLTGTDVPGEGSVVNQARVEREFAQADDQEQFGDWVVTVPFTDRRAEDVLKSGSEWTQETIWQPVASGAETVAGSPVGAVAGAATNPGGGIRPEAERRARARGAVEGAGHILDLAGLALTGKEAVEFVGAFGETQPLRRNGETGAFIGAAAGAGALAAAGFTQQAIDEPQRTGGQVVGSLAGSGALIGGAARVGGARTGRAVSYGVQPGEELAITAARSGVVPSRVATLVPGVRRGHIRGRSEGSDRGFLADDRGQLELAGPRSETDTEAGSVASEMQRELRRMEQAAQRREARTRAEQRVREQAGEEGPPDPVTVEGQPEEQIRSVSGQPESQIHTADPARVAPHIGPTPAQQAAWRSSLTDPGTSGLSSRQRQLASQRHRDVGDLVPMGDLREVDAGVRALEADLAGQQALSVTQQAGATAGMAGAVTFGAQQRLQDAQTPQVTFDETLRGRPETLIDSTTGVGVLDLEADMMASVSDFQGNLADTQTRTETAQASDVRTDVTPTELEETAQDVVTEPRERVGQEMGQEMQQEQDARQRQELRQEQEQEPRLDQRTDLTNEQRTELRTEIELETEFDQRIETRSELETQPEDPWELGALDVGGWGPSLGASDDRLNPGWLTETIFTFATSGRETPRAPSQEVLEAQPGSLRRTGELPVAFSDQAQAEAFSDFLEFFDPTPNPDITDVGVGVGGTGGAGQDTWDEWTGWDDDVALLDVSDQDDDVADDWDDWRDFV